jgi:hypothetical protein
MNTEINKLKSRALESMKTYMESFLEDDDDAGYTDKDIQKCQKILDDFLKSLAETPVDNKQIVVMDVVKKTVLALNKLNEKCDYCLIETDQREDLATLIVKAAGFVGVGNGVDDMTEKWRKW